MTCADAVFLVALLTLGVCYVYCLHLYAEAERQRTRAANLERWLRGHLLLIRAECYESASVLSVVNSIECALPILAPIDVRGLARDISAIERRRTAELLRAASEIQGGGR